MMQAWSSSSPSAASPVRAGTKPRTRPAPRPAAAPANRTSMAERIAARIADDPRLQPSDRAGASGASGAPLTRNPLHADDQRRVADLLRLGQRSAAVNYVRQRTGWGLTECMRVVEFQARGH